MAQGREVGVVQGKGGKDDTGERNREGTGEGSFYAIKIPLLTAPSQKHML